MKLKKLLTASSIALMAMGAVAGLASCSSKKEGTVVFWHTMGKDKQTILDGFIEAFNKTDEGKDVTIEHSSQGDYSGIRDKCLNAITGKQLPTMAYCYPDHVADYLEAGVVKNLDDFIESDDPTLALSDEDLEDLSTYWGEGQSYDQNHTTYSVPFCKSTETMFYNSKAVAWYKQKGYLTSETGLPTKWCQSYDENGNIVDDFTDENTVGGWAKVMKDHYEEYYKAVNPSADAATVASAVSSFYSFSYDSDANLFITLMEQFGYKYTSLNDDNTGNFDFLGSNAKGSSQARGVMTLLNTLYRNGYLLTAALDDQHNYTSDAFKAETTFVSVGSTGGATYNEGSTFTTEVAAVPQQNASSPKVISQGPSIVFFNARNISEKSLENAWKFYKFITNAENSAYYSINSGYEPVRKSSYETTTYLEFVESDNTVKHKVATVTQTYAANNCYFYSPAFVGSATSRNVIETNLIPGVLRSEDSVEKALDDNFANIAATLLF